MKRVGIPLILTFKLDDESQTRLNSWRKTYFPPERNHLEAHLTIYHQLPGQQISAIQEALRTFAASQVTGPLPIHFHSLLHRQGFVGVALSSPPLLEAKAGLDTLFKESLRAQDRQGYRPHVTVTNLGSTRDGEHCYETLTPLFRPWQGSAVGLELFHYRNGPWEHAESFLFSDKTI